MDAVVIELGAQRLAELAALALALSACEPPEPSAPWKIPPRATAPASAGQVSRAGTLRIDEGRVWLESDGERWLLGEARRPWWRSFDGLGVKVRGVESSSATSERALRVDDLEVVRIDGVTPLDAPVALGPERWITGRFAHHVWPEGSKLAGGPPWLVFVGDDGTQYWLAGPRHYEQLVGRRVRVHGRAYEPSPFIARPGGPYLWIDQVRR